jgi:hypothetical protein
VRLLEARSHSQARKTSGCYPCSVRRGCCVRPFKDGGQTVTPLPGWIKVANERFARFSGSRFSPHELPGGPRYGDKAAVRQATKVCRDCRKREVKPRQWYCPDCARKNKRDSNRRHIRRKRGLDVGKLANSPIGAEALTKAEKQVGYPYPKTSISGSSFPTGQRAATRNAREKESISLPGSHEHGKRRASRED